RWPRSSFAAMSAGCPAHQACTAPETASGEEPRLSAPCGGVPDLPAHGGQYTFAELDDRLSRVGCERRFSTVERAVSECELNPAPTDEQVDLALGTVSVYLAAPERLLAVTQPVKAERFEVGPPLA